MTYKELVTYSSGGLYCIPGRFFMDPVKPVPLAVVTHAHADHANPYSSLIFCTPATAALIRWRYRGKETGKIVERNFFEPFEIQGVSVTLLPAGHMLGSAQVLLDDGKEKWLYTGDFKLQADATTEPYTFAKADVLITETTFAEPSIVHPDPVQEILKINVQNDRNVIIAVYSIGKAQRIARLLAEHCPQRLVMVHPDIYGFNRIYESFGISLGEWKPYQAAGFKAIRHGIYLAPPYHFRNFRRSQRHYLGFASGWDFLQRKCDIRLMISDHGDWADVLRIVDFTNPKKIYTLHGEGKWLREEMKSRGLEVARFN